MLFQPLNGMFVVSPVGLEPTTHFFIISNSELSDDLLDIDDDDLMLE